MRTKQRSQITRWRKKAGLSQSALAERLGVSHSMVSRFESGEKPLGSLPALKLQDVSGGEILAKDCVSAERVAELEGVTLTMKGSS